MSKLITTLFFALILTCLLIVLRPILAVVSDKAIKKHLKEAENQINTCKA